MQDPSACWVRQLGSELIKTITPFELDVVPDVWVEIDDDPDDDDDDEDEDEDDPDEEDPPVDDDPADDEVEPVTHWVPASA